MSGPEADPTPTSGEPTRAPDSENGSRPVEPVESDERAELVRSIGRAEPAERVESTAAGILPAAQPPSPAPRGPGLFTLHDRPLPAVYLLAWILSVGGALLVFVGVQADTAVARLVLVLGGLVAASTGLALAAGYQVVARAGRSPERYRGPSPLILFGLVFVLSNLAEGLLSVLGVQLGLGGTGLLAALLVTAVAYVGTVRQLVVRSGALSWSQMGWPTSGDLVGRAVGALAYGAILAIPVRLLIGAWSILLVTLLGTDAPAQFETPVGVQDTLLVLVAAILVAPLFEELFFRGFAYTAWRRDLGVRSALVRSALLFAAVHTLGPAMDPAQALLVFLVILPLAFFLGWLRETRGILASIGAHAVYNGSVLLLLVAARPPGT